MEREKIDRILKFAEVSSKCKTNFMKFFSMIGEDTADKISAVYTTPNETLCVMWENDLHGRCSLEFGDNTFSYYYLQKKGYAPCFLSGVMDEAFVKEIVEHVEKLVGAK